MATGDVAGPKPDRRRHRTDAARAKRGGLARVTERERRRSGGWWWRGWGPTA